MKKHRTIIACLGLLISLIFCRQFLYDALYGFDDQKSYRADIAESRVIVKLFPGCADSHAKLGEMLLAHLNDTANRQQRLSETMFELTESVRLDNRQDAIYYDLGQLYEVEYKDWITANSFYFKCVELNPACFTYQGALAQSYEALGNQERYENHKHIANSLMSASGNHQTNLN